MTPLPQDDLADIVGRVGPLWDRLRDKRLFVTGGTGFIGRWMVESACHDGVEPDFDLYIWNRSKHGDLRNVRPRHLVEEIPSDYILHLAASTDRSNPEACSIIRDGTRRVCAFVQQCGAKLLHASSGCVGDAGQRHRYGAFAEAKADAEQMVADVGGINARIYGTFGPGMRFDRSYAIGDFLSNALAGEPIQVKDGAAIRSFLYASDLAVALWRLLLDARPGTYNVGSRVPWGISAVAAKVSDVTGVPVSQDTIDWSAGTSIYWPVVSVAEETVNIQSGIQKTWDWLCESRNTSSAGSKVSASPMSSV